MAQKKGNALVGALMHAYDNQVFIYEDGSFNTATCGFYSAPVFKQFGLKGDGTFQVLGDDIIILPDEVLCPYSYFTGKKRITRQTVSVHHYGGSWQDDWKRKMHRDALRRYRIKEQVDAVIHLPNRLCKAMLGDKNYKNLKKLAGKL